MVYSYAKPDMQRAGAWAAVVKSRIQKGTLASPEHVFMYSTGSMNPEHYAEAWSLAGVLADIPGEFEEVVRSVRDGSKAIDVVQSTYDLSTKDLHAAWKRIALRRK
jgi:hypothetical protein